MFCRVIEKLHYIALDGPIGAGKTTLAHMIAEDYGARFICENPDANPFLPLFYDDPARHAFQTQLYFLLSRFQQQKEIKQQDLFKQKVVCDYVFAKDLIFAKLNMTPDEFDLYMQVYQMLDKHLPKPDAVIYLQADVDVLMKRVRKRNKDYEDHIDRDYLQRVSQAFSQYFFQYDEAPVLVVNATGLDIVNHKQDYETLKKELFSLIKSGKDKHYVTIDQR